MPVLLGGWTVVLFQQSSPEIAVEVAATPVDVVGVV